MLERTWKKIIRQEGFSLWRIPAFLLWLASFAYRLLFYLKKTFAGRKLRLDVPVVSVGNITVGGTGKTTLVAFLGRFLLNDGIRVAIVSSGYRRASKESFVKPGYKVQNMDTLQTGDEVKLLAQLLPEALFSVDEKKALAARNVAETGQADMIIVDDGFQHFALERDIDIVTFDAGIRRRLLRPFPYGLLREPVKALKRADVIIITRSKFARDLSALRKRLRSINERAQHYHAGFVAEELVGKEQTLSVKYLEDKSVFLFAGVGNFEALKRQVSALCADLDYALELSDHQRYDDKTLEKIKAIADKHDSDLILTTAKDWVKVEHFDFRRESYYLTQTVDLDPGEEKLVSYIRQTLKIGERGA